MVDPVNQVNAELLLSFLFLIKERVKQLESHRISLTEMQTALDQGIKQLQQDQEQKISTIEDSEKEEPSHEVKSDDGKAACQT